MLKDQIEQLETLIPELVEEARRLRRENRDLEARTERLQREVDRLREKQTALETDTGRLRDLERRNKKHESERADLRSRVQGLLEELENIDFA